MSVHEHFKTPDTGVASSVLFTYDPAEPGTGALVIIVNPGRLLERETMFVKNERIQITFLVNRERHTGEAILADAAKGVTTDRQTFDLADDFYKRDEVSLTILFTKWKIVAIIDGKPLLVRDVK